ncbi:MAG TPA: rRNA maturation RNase YbeY [Lachnospiraceae bacterium]|nr:rRNA maturation RNase YbeY [Lachnospiraceae bacterium]
MTVLIDNRTDWSITPEYEKLINDVALKCLEYEEFDTNCEISLSFVTGEEIKEINAQFRHIDKETDVLSFPMLNFEEDEKADVNENDEIILGDIIISINRAKEQAKEYGHSLQREIAFLTAHSMFHLLGFDHMEEDEEKEMFAKQKEVLDILDIKR